LPCTSSADLPADWQLVLSRLVLVDVELNPPLGSSPGSSTGPVGPTLWPLNAFQSVGTALVMQDVRLVIPSTMFRQYLEFFSAQPSLQSNLNTTLHTVSGAGAGIRHAGSSQKGAKELGGNPLMEACVGCTHG
jgi:hypothetical protein